jgi:peptide/nickel transport system substrate-binding protein
MAYPDPHMIAAQVDNNYSMHVFEGLLSLAEDYSPKPQLAESFDVSADGKTYTFKLRKGVKFHDGKEMTSADVLASFERYRRISPNRGVLARVAAMKAPDPLTFVLEISEPQPLLPELIISPRYQLAILPAADKDTGPNANSGIGTGPYRFVERKPDSHVRLARFDGYVPNPAYDGPSGYGGKRQPTFDTITFRVAPEGASRVAGVQTGEMQLVDNLPVQSANRLGANKQIRIIDVMPYSKMVTIMHASQPPTDNPLVRRAIQAAIDNDDVMEVALEGFYKPEHSFLFKSSPYYAGDLNRELYSQGNPKKARELLAKAGYKGEPVSIMTTSDYAFMKNGMLVVAEQLKAAGINVKMEMVDWQTNVAHRSKGTGGWNITTTGYGSFPLEGPQSYQSVFRQMAHIENDKVLDEGFVRLIGSPTLEERKKAWRDIETRMATEAYILVNGDRGMKMAATTRLRTLEPFYSIRLWNSSLAGE